jgi:hypothetical protein
MNDGNNKKPGTGQESGFCQKKIVYRTIVIAVIFLTAILLSKFYFNADLLSTSSAEMSLKQQSAHNDNPSLGVKVNVSVRPSTIMPTITKIPFCSARQTFCDGFCVDTSSDENNCGSCGNVCFNSGIPHVSEYSCVDGRCGIKTCEAGYSDCSDTGQCMDTSDCSMYNAPSDLSANANDVPIQSLNLTPEGFERSE